MKQKGNTYIKPRLAWNASSSARASGSSSCCMAAGSVSTWPYRASASSSSPSSQKPATRSRLHHQWASSSKQQSVPCTLHPSNGTGFSSPNVSCSSSVKCSMSPLTPLPVAVRSAASLDLLPWWWSSFVSLPVSGPGPAALPLPGEPGPLPGSRTVRSCPDPTSSWSACCSRFSRYSRITVGTVAERGEENRRAVHPLTVPEPAGGEKAEPVRREQPAEPSARVVAGQLLRLGEIVPAVVLQQPGVAPLHAQRRQQIDLDRIVHRNDGRSRFRHVDRAQAHHQPVRVRPVGDEVQLVQPVVEQGQLARRVQRVHPVALRLEQAAGAARQPPPNVQPVEEHAHKLPGGGRHALHARRRQRQPERLQAQLRLASVEARDRGSSTGSPYTSMRTRQKARNIRLTSATSSIEESRDQKYGSSTASMRRVVPSSSGASGRPPASESRLPNGFTTSTANMNMQIVIRAFEDMPPSPDSISSSSRSSPPFDESEPDPGKGDPSIELSEWAGDEDGFDSSLRGGVIGPIIRCRMWSIALRRMADLFSFASTPTTMFFSSTMQLLMEVRYRRSIALCADRFTSFTFGTPAGWRRVSCTFGCPSADCWEGAAAAAAAAAVTWVGASSTTGMPAARDRAAQRVDERVQVRAGLHRDRAGDGRGARDRVHVRVRVDDGRVGEQKDGLLVHRLQREDLLHERLPACDQILDAHVRNAGQQVGRLLLLLLLLGRCRSRGYLLLVGASVGSDVAAGVGWSWGAQSSTCFSSCFGDCNGVDGLGIGWKSVSDGEDGGTADGSFCPTHSSFIVTPAPLGEGIAMEAEEEEPEAAAAAADVSPIVPSQLSVDRKSSPIMFSSFSSFI
uniref:Uncharacterized protein n=1 Tax=Anopheles coluzzii TaxID=1518534 RepID=A0A8W7PLJ9_ANOCL